MEMQESKECDRCGESSICDFCYAKKMILHFCYIFHQHGADDLEILVAPQSVQFMRDDGPLPFPHIGFLTDSKDTDRYNANIRQIKKLSESTLVNVSLKNMRLFISVANAIRSSLERNQGRLQDNMDQVGLLYSDAINVSGDESGIKILGLIKRRPKKLTFCSTDDMQTGLVQLDIRIGVAEAFAGLATVAVYGNQMHMAIGYATAALFKHSSALPLVNCARIVAMAHHNVDMAAHLTRWVILPYYLRMGDAVNHAREMCIWGPLYKEVFSHLPEELTSKTSSVVQGVAGKKGVIQGKYKNSKFVRKLCAVCCKGTQEDEKVKACSRCGMVYYCGKECQLAHWSQHRRECCANDVEPASS
jgi:hypothetical protein